MKNFLSFLSIVLSGEINRCSVINCKKEIKDNNFKIIDGKIFCLECATIYFSNFIKSLQ